MRKFFSFFAALLFAGSMMAQVTITPENSSWTSTAGAQTGTVEGVTVAVTNGVTGSTSAEGATMRIYKDATLTISSASNISKIEFTCTANGTTKYGPGCFAAQDGYSYEGKVGTWTGSATSVSFTASTNQVRATQIVVTLGDAPAVAAPAIAGEANFFDSTTITITCATEGATIYYTLDGSEPNNQSTAYTAPFQLKETATVKAYAQKDTDLSAVTSKTFTKAPSFASFEALIAAELPDKTIVEVSFENVKIDSFYVSSQSKKQGLYFTVNEKAYEIYYNKAEVPETWEVGGTVSGTIRGNWTVYKGLWEIVPSANDWAWALTYNAPAPAHTYTVAGAPAALFGNEWAPADANNDMNPVLGGDLYVWKKDSVNLTAGDIEFKVCEDHGWAKAYPAQNYKLNIAEAGYYDILIRFNPTAEPDSMIKAGATKVGELPVVENWDEITFTAATAVGAFNDSVFAVGDFKLTCVDPDNNKLKTTANTAYFGSSDLDSIRYDFRLQTSGKSSAKNALNLTIPADGMLRIAVRTGSNADLSRTLVLVQGQDTLYNQVVVETDTIEGYTAPKIYKYVKVAVKAGTVAVSYPVNALNFYAFGFKADEAPVVKPVYTVVGSSAPLFGKTWDPEYEANNMEPITGSEYLYAWKKEGVALAAGTIEYKVCKDKGWNPAWPAQGNYSFNIAEDGLYDVAIFFNPDLETPTQVIAEKKGEVVVLPNIIMHGNFTGSWADTDPFTPAADSLTASLTLALTEGTYEFGFKFDGTWKANGATITREANTANLATGSGNMKIAADVPGNYLFTYTYATQEVVVTYPEPIIVPDTIDVTMSSLTAPGSLIWDDEVATEGWWQIMGGNDTCQFSLSNGNQITTAAGTYTVADLDAGYSYIAIVKANDTIDVAFVDGSITVAVDEAGVVTIVGALLGNDGNVYNFNLTYVDPKAETTVNVTISNGALIDNYASYGLYGVYGYADDKSAYVQLGIWAENGFQGNFTEDDFDLKYIGCVVVTPAGNVRIFSAAITVTPGNIEGEYNITADLLCYNNTLYKVTMTISKAQGVEDVKAGSMATKSLQNGILVIEKNGVKYNVTGLQIR